MSVINNLIAVPSHARAMPIRPANGLVNASAKIRIDDSERAREPISPPRKWPPSNATRLAHPLPQVGLDPFATQGDPEKLKPGDNKRDNRYVAANYDVNSIHSVEWPNDPSSATRHARAHDCNHDAMAGFAAAHG